MGQVRGLGAEPYRDQAVSFGGHQRIDDGSEFVGPFGAGGEDDGAGAGDGPVSRVVSDVFRFLGEPAVAEDFEMEAGCVVQIGFESYSLFVLVPEAHDPLRGKRTGQQANRDFGVFEPVRGEGQLSLQTRSTEPAGFDDASLTRAGDLHEA